MGRPNLEELELVVQYKANGTVEGVRYADHEGCGWEGKLMPPETPVGEFVRMHLDHAASSHDVHPVIMCDYEAVLNDGSKIPPKVYCMLEKHGSSTQHVLKFRT